MRLKISVLAVLFFIIFSHANFGQIANYQYKRSLNDVSGVWHKIILPNDIFAKVSPGLSDLRIYGVTAGGDTVEAPYVLRLNEDTYNREAVDFELLNTTHNQKGYYYTFEVPSANAVTSIVLDFQEANYDRLVTLEGSQDQKEWYTIVDQSRIVSIKNNLTQYTFSTLSFSSVKYKYLRLLVPSEKTAPVLNSAKITEEKFVPGNYVDHPVKEIEVTEDKDRNQTVVQLELNGTVSVSHIKINVADKFDYYRPVDIQYLYDSLSTPNGWKEQYRTAVNGTLSSLEKNEFKFRSVVTNKFKILINNNDNTPLKLDDVIVKGNVYELVTRFIEPASYFLVYGNEQANSPEYDIVNFTNKIPESIPAVTIGAEEIIERAEVQSSAPLFENQAWLWAVMGLIIFILGLFSVRMIRK